MGVQVIRKAGSPLMIIDPPRQGALTPDAILRLNSSLAKCGTTSFYEEGVVRVGLI